MLLKGIFALNPTQDGLISNFVCKCVMGLSGCLSYFSKSLATNSNPINNTIQVSTKQLVTID